MAGVLHTQKLLTTNQVTPENLIQFSPSIQMSINILYRQTDRPMVAWGGPQIKKHASPKIQFQAVCFMKNAQISKNWTPLGYLLS